jgi:hypothetical protein
MYGHIQNHLTTVQETSAGIALSRVQGGSPADYLSRVPRRITKAWPLVVGTRTVTTYNV